MSEDGFSDSSDEPNMEIQIETLMGGSFDLRVSATDTVQEIKRRINRVEGIPIAHQNLLFQNGELQDHRRLVDVGIKDGARLKLVLSMRGGPISTRRISTACEHQLMLKELKEFLDSTREEIDERLAPGSKISVLVFKEGDIINLLRVIENEDGTYVPYSEKPISPPPRTGAASTSTNGGGARIESRSALFEKLVEDNRMMSNVATLRKKMEDATAARRRRDNKNDANLTFKVFEAYKADLMMADKEEGNLSESEEIALKDKHRSKQIRSPRSLSRSSVYSETKGACSHTKHAYVRMQHKKGQKMAPSDDLGAVMSPLRLQGAENPLEMEEMMSNRLRCARLVIADNAEQAKAGAESLELEENGGDLWAPTTTASTSRQHLKSATYKLGVLKRRQSLNYGIDDAGPKVPQELSECNGTTTTGYEVYSSGNFYHMPPPFMTSPSAIPPQYAPKNQEICDYYYRNRPRSPLYGRKTSRGEAAAANAGAAESADFNTKFAKLPEIKSSEYNNNNNNGIERLKNDRNEVLDENAIDELCSFYNLGAETAKLLDFEKNNERLEEKIELPPVIKKRARCNFCNRKLNITNIYNCRCGKIFCSQHRYSEVHHCNYDYKTDGRRFLEQQNPLVTADKINRF